jgi:hypothetical protein
MTILIQVEVPAHAAGAIANDPRIATGPPAIPTDLRTAIRPPRTVTVGLEIRDRRQL